jgi:ribosomal-protein-alanine N-acetyltransferase
MMAEGACIRLAIERREDKRVVGEALIFNFAMESKRADLGYALARNAWGSGYVSEALVPLLDYGFKQVELNRLQAVIDPRNAASARVLERLGFQYEGRQREHYIVRGETTDSGLYGLLRREWEARRTP